MRRTKPFCREVGEFYHLYDVLAQSAPAPYFGLWAERPANGSPENMFGRLQGGLHGHSHRWVTFRDARRAVLFAGLSSLLFLRVIYWWLYSGTMESKVTKKREGLWGALVALINCTE